MNPQYAKHFSSLMQKYGLKQLGNTNGTQKRYRAALLNMADNHT
jgi:hypothetical protein